jgi:Tol biopolymer transport system component
MLERAGEPDLQQIMATVSPDGSRLALDRTADGNRDVWITDLQRGSMVRLTFGAGWEGTPVWSPDGRQIAFESTKAGHFNLFVKPSSGEGDEVHLQPSERHQWPLDWSRNGKFLLYYDGEIISDGNLFALPMTGVDRQPVPIATSTFAEVSGAFSPDGRWIAYQTNESGRFEIVVQGFPDRAAGRAQVSTNGGKTPKWSPDGREVYFVAPDGKLMAVSFAPTTPAFNVKVPVALFQTAIADWYGIPQYDVDRSGRFLMPVKQESGPPLTLLLNWKPAS